MKYKYLLLVFGLLFFHSTSSYGQLFGWDTFGLLGSEASISPTFANGNLTTTAIVRNGGLTASALGNAFSSATFTATGTKVDAETNNRGLSFTVQVNAGFTMSLTTLDAKFRRSTSGPNTFGWYYSTDGVTFTQIGADISYTGTATNGALQTQIDLSVIAALQAVPNGTTVTFRLLGWGATATTGTFALGRYSSGGSYSLAIGGSINSTCTPPANPAAAISGTTPGCGSTVLTYAGTATAPVVNYWQTSATGTSTTNDASIGLTVSTSGTYYVRAKNTSTNCWSSGASAGYAVVINNNPTVTNPSNTSIIATNNATFSVTATNASAYTWQESTDGGGTYNNITNGGVYSGATTATLTLTAVPIGMNGYMYQCFITPIAPCASFAFSTAATLTVNPNVSAASDIVAVASSEPATISSTVNNVTIATSTDGVQVWQFTIRDGGAGLNDTDTVGTTLTAFNLAQAAGNSVSTWSDAIFSVGLFYGSTFIANGTVTTNQIQFSGLSVLVADGTQKTLSLRLSLKCPLASGAVDGNDFGFSLSNTNTTFLITGSGKSAFAAATSANSFNVIDVTATKLIFTTQPVNTGQNNTMASVVVKATDACGNVDTGFTGTVSLSSTGTMNAVTPTAAVAGVVTFSTIVHTVVGTGYTLTAAATGLTNATSTTFNITAVTIFSEGDFAVVGVNSNINSGACVYTGSNTYSAGDDEISFITFKDIQNGDVFYITDNGYERTTAGLWGDTEGVYQITRSGGTILAGTVITFRFMNLTPFMEFVSPDTSWTFTKATGFTGNLVMNTGGDQIFFMQGGTWTNPGGAHDATYTPGTLLYGFNTGTSWTSLGSSTQQSALPLALRCFNLMPGSATDYLEYTGPTTAASKYDWIIRLNDPTNWTNRASCAGYTRMHVGMTYTINADTYVNGVWTGTKSTDWFDCGNWQTLKVPVATTDVNVNATYATKDAIIDVVANTANATLYSNQAKCKDLSVSSRKVQLEASTSNTLDVNGNLSITAAGAIDMDDSNSATADGQINLYGNWTNSVGNTAFSEGNGTVKFTGSGTQVINNVTPEGTETFYNVILNNNFDTSLSNDLIASNNLTVNASKTLTVDKDGYVRVNNKLSDNGAILLDSDPAGTAAGQLIQVNDTDSNDGDYSGTNFRVKRTALAKETDYVYWGSPLTTYDVSGLPNGYRFLWNTTYNNANGTQGVWNSASGNMTPGKGYIALANNNSTSAIPLTTTFSGSKPNNGSFNFSVYRGNYTGADYDADPVDLLNVDTTKYDDNWNLLSNPYPSAIDAENFLVLNQTVIDGSVWIWKHGLLPNFTTSPFYGTFTYNYSSTDYIKYNGLGSTDPDTFAGKIGSCQGFMVSMKDVGSLFATGATTNLDVYNSTISFNNSLRSDSSINPYMPQNNTDFYKSSIPSFGNPIVEEKHRIWIDIINDTSHQADTMLLGYSSSSTMARDNLYDCFFVPRSDVSLYSMIGDESFIIQGRPLPFDDNDMVPLGINIMEAGSHTIAIHKVDGLFLDGTNIYLEDKALNIIHDLKQAPYVFTSAKGKFNNRFVLRYKNETLANPDFDALQNSVIVSGNHGSMAIKSSLETMQEVTVFDVLGRQLLHANTIGNNDFEAANVTSSEQTLIVKIKLTDGTIVTKKIIL